MTDEFSLKDLVEDEDSKSFVIKKPAGFTNLDTPPSKVYQYKEAKLLLKDIANFLYKDRQFFKVVLGEKGIGKTVSIVDIQRKLNGSDEVEKERVSYFIKSVNSHAKSDSEKINNSNYMVNPSWKEYPFLIYVNCKQHSSKKNILKEIMNVCGISISARTSIESQFRAFFKDLKVVIILDEVDHINYEKRSGPSIFTELMLTNPDNVFFSLIMITNSQNWLDEMRDFDPDFQARYFIEKDDKVPWNRPQQDEIREILQFRVDECVDGDVDSGIIDEISALTFSKYKSNLRIAIRSTYAVLKATLDDKKYNIQNLMDEQAVGLLREALAKMLDRNISVLYLASFFDTSTAIYKAYSAFCEAMEDIPATNPTYQATLDDLNFNEYIRLFKGEKVKTKSHVEMRADKDAVRDEFEKRYGEGAIEIIARIVREMNRTNPGKNKTLA